MFRKYVDQLKANGPLPQILGKIIEDHKQKAENMKMLYGRYVGSEADVPIYTRVLPVESNKIDNKLAHDWFGEIVDTKHGYMFGIPVTISVDKAAQAYEETVKTIDRFGKVNNIDDLNGESGKMSAICGYDGLLAYVDTEGNERVMRVDPWETCIISKSDITQPQYGLRYYKTPEGRLHVTFYDESLIYDFEGTDSGTIEQVGVPYPHMFDYCPLVGVPNNAELQGDPEKVLSLIDAYDRSNSDFNSEIEQFRLAYLLFVGYEPDKEQLDKMRQTGALWIPTSSEGEDIRFLTKQIMHEAIDSHLDRLEANIIRFSKHVNFTDAAFGGDITGPAMRFKLFMLETKAKVMERKHEAAMRYLYKVVGSAWKKRRLSGFDYTQIDLIYTRNIPVNVLDAANTAKALIGVTSHETLLSVLPIVKDVQEEMKKIQEEKDANIDLDNLDNPEEDDTTTE